MAALCHQQQQQQQQEKQQCGGDRSRLSREQRGGGRRRAALVSTTSMVTLSSLALAFAAGAPSAAAFCVMAATNSVHVCTNTSCRKANSRGTLETFRAFSPPGVEVVETGCQGRCGLGPNVLTRPSEEVYNGVAKPSTVAAIIEIDFGFPVPDALVGAFGHISDGDVFFQRNLYADALDCYNRCIDSKDAFEGSDRALSVAKVKQSSAMLEVAKKPSKGSADPTLKDAEKTAREAVSLWPANTPAWLLLSDVLADMGRLDDALDNLDGLKLQYPDAKSEASQKASMILNRQ